MKIILFILIPIIILAQDATTIGSLNITPTIENAGFIIYYDGDDDEDMTATVQICDSDGNNCQTVSSSGTTIPTYIDRRTQVNDGGSTVSNVYEKTIRGSIFELTRNTAYTLKITFSDGDGVSGTNPATSQFTTWSHDQESNSGTTYDVSDDDELASAIASASGGDIISIASGTYLTTSLSASGSSNNPVKYVAADQSNMPEFTGDCSGGGGIGLSYSPL